MNIRFYNAKILLTKEDKSFEILEGELWVKGNEICYIGDGSREEKVYEGLALPVILWDREIDVKGNLLMPGFKNAHTHSGMTFLRSMADDLPLQEWLFEKVFPKENQLQEEDLYWLTALANLEYLTSGITSQFDMYFFQEQGNKPFFLPFMSLVIQGSAPLGNYFNHYWREGHQDKYQNDHSKFQRTKCQQVLHAYSCKEENELHTVNNNLTVSAKRRIHSLKGSHIIPACYKETGGTKHYVAMINILADQHDSKYTACDSHSSWKCIHKHIPQKTTFDLVKVIFLGKKEGRNPHCTCTDQ